MGGTRLICDPDGAALSLDLTNRVQRLAPEHVVTALRQTLAGLGGLRTERAGTDSLPAGQLTLPLTGTERATFHTWMVDYLVSSAVLRVFPDADRSARADVQLAGAEVEERYTFDTRLGTHTLTLDVVVVEEVP